MTGCSTPPACRSPPEPEPAADRACATGWPAQYAVRWKRPGPGVTSSMRRPRRRAPRPARIRPGTARLAGGARVGTPGSARLRGEHDRLVDQPQVQHDTDQRPLRDAPQRGTLLRFDKSGEQLTFLREEDSRIAALFPGFRTSGGRCLAGHHRAAVRSREHSARAPPPELPEKRCSSSSTEPGPSCSRTRCVGRWG